MAPGEGRCSFDWGPGIAGDHPRAYHLVEGHRIGPVSREVPNCSPAEAGCDQVVGDEMLMLEVDLLIVSDTASRCGLEEQEQEQHNRLERGVGVLVEEVEQEQEVDTGTVGQEQRVVELEEGAGRPDAIVAVAAAAARQDHNHS